MIANLLKNKQSYFIDSKLDLRRIISIKITKSFLSKLLFFLIQALMNLLSIENLNVQK